MYYNAAFFCKALVVGYLSAITIKDCLFSSWLVILIEVIAK